jgi:probable rRNA maturation factor
MNIVIANRQRTKKVNSRLLKRIVIALLSELKLERAELGIRLVGAREMARVNWRYLRHEGSTDVITFDHLNSSFVIRHSSLQLHGELFVCVDDAVKQAAEFRTTWQSEVLRYAVHGVLHLAGHDDAKPELRRKMKREENRLVRRLEQGFPLSEL